MNDIDFMKKAIEISIEKQKMNDGGPFGAVITKDNQIISEGWNHVISHKDPTMHGEIDAIRKACKVLATHDLSGCILYSSTEPCPMCLSAIYWANIEKVFYGNSRNDAENIGFRDGFLYEELQLPLDKRKLPFIQLLREESIKAFELWTNKKDKTMY